MCAAGAAFPKGKLSDSIEEGAIHWNWLNVYLVSIIISYFQAQSIE